jgi:hypothetical protein
MNICNSAAGLGHLTRGQDRGFSMPRADTTQHSPDGQPHAVLWS